MKLLKIDGFDFHETCANILTCIGEGWTEGDDLTLKNTSLQKGIPNNSINTILRHTEYIILYNKANMSGLIHRLIRQIESTLFCSTLLYLSINWTATVNVLWSAACLPVIAKEIIHKKGTETRSSSTMNLSKRVIIGTGNRYCDKNIGKLPRFWGRKSRRKFLRLLYLVTVGLELPSQHLPRNTNDFNPVALSPEMITFFSRRERKKFCRERSKDYESTLKASFSFSLRLTRGALNLNSCLTAVYCNV